MEHYINSMKTGLVVGAFLAGFHLIWVILVNIGVAKAILDFVFWAHMLTFVFVVNPFDPVAAATLILFTAIMGFVYGYLFALIWNRLHRA